MVSTPAAVSCRPARCVAPLSPLWAKDVPLERAVTDIPSLPATRLSANPHHIIFQLGYTKSWSKTVDSSVVVVHLSPSRGLLAARGALVLKTLYSPDLAPCDFDFSKDQVCLK